MQGTVLVIDGISTNRIMLKVQLSASYYRVVQAAGLAGIDETIRQVRPDLIISATKLPDGDARDLRASLRSRPDTTHIPMLGIVPENDRMGRLSALRAGMDDVLSRPVNDMVLLARVRALIRKSVANDVIDFQADANHAVGFAEPAMGFETQPHVAIVARDPSTAMRWQRSLGQASRHRLTAHSLGDLPELMSSSSPDAILFDIVEANSSEELRLISELQARGATRTSAILAIIDPPDDQRCAELLDRGADDVMDTGLDTEELQLRLSAQIRRKAQASRLRDQVRDGLRAAVTDPMTGLYNRRYAMPRLTQIAREAEASGQPFALLIADLDHFKSINDAHGHAAGDAVLVEAAARMRNGLRPQDMLARIGGEEFMIVLPETDAARAAQVAEALCAGLRDRPVSIPGQRQALRATMSIGAATWPGDSLQTCSADDLVQAADMALYEAKHCGRDKVHMMARSAA